MRQVAAAWLVALFACTGASEDGPPGDPDAGVDDGDAGPPDTTALVINELMARNRLAVLDDHGGHADWVELYNPAAEDVSLRGWAVTDDLGEPRKHALDGSLVVPAGGYLVLWLDGETDLGPAHAGFRLGTDGGEVGLTRPDGSVADAVEYGQQTTDLSYARVPNAGVDWRVVWEITPGAANPDSVEPMPPIADVSELVLGDDLVPELALELSDAAIDDLRDDPYAWVPGVLVFRGRRFAPVGVRLKGQNSFQPIDAKPSFKVKLDRYVQGAELFGLDDLTLNNMDDDPTMVHERLAYGVARRVGVPAPRANHALVSVNGQPYGLYANVETTDRRLIERWFADASGSLYEGWDVDFTDEYIDRYEHEGGPDDRSTLEALADALLLPGPEAMAAAAAYVDLDEFRRYWAMCAVIGQFDSFPYSSPGDDYHLYIDPTTGLMSFLPWGMDETFSQPARNVLAVSSVLARKCLEAPACAGALVAEINDVLDAVEAADLTGELDRVVDEVSPLVAADARKPYSDAQVAQAQANMRAFIANRRAALEAMLP